MMPRLLDLFCCQGGAGEGYHRAGFDVTGVDVTPQPRYPHSFVLDDALDILRRWRQAGPFVAIHASPPCQAYTTAQRLNGNKHPDLVSELRELLDGIGLPYVIENVRGAPLLDPIELCGSMFSLGTYRHRRFESNVPLVAPEHPAHVAKTTKMGRKPQPGEMMHVVGNFSGVAEARVAMGIDWMTRDGLRESVPPAYTEYIGAQLLDHIGVAAA